MRLRTAVAAVSLPRLPGRRSHHAAGWMLMVDVWCCGCVFCGLHMCMQCCTFNTVHTRGCVCNRNVLIYAIAPRAPCTAKRKRTVCSVSARFRAPQRGDDFHKTIRNTSQKHSRKSCGLRLTTLAGAGDGGGGCASKQTRCTRYANLAWRVWWCSRHVCVLRFYG